MARLVGTGALAVTTTLIVAAALGLLVGTGQHRAHQAVRPETVRAAAAGPTVQGSPPPAVRVRSYRTHAPSGSSPSTLRDRVSPSRERTPLRASRSAPLSGLRGIARRVAWCESRLNPRAENKRSTASGLFQFLAGTWRSVTGLRPPASDYSVATQVAAFWRLWDNGNGAGQWAASRSCWA